ncbi:hypothetical protein E2C01_091599 [Portunus trituberculatus]|uniref:Uncharacterized protein n=1 Tax=Portunus trituberculatus TaxID=210409 RepID=A0A5B7JPH5_PORTR|nr:hypothetical protein [Portunus trituberculatus]
MPARPRQLSAFLPACQRQLSSLLARPRNSLHQPASPRKFSIHLPASPRKHFIHLLPCPRKHSIACYPARANTPSPATLPAQTLLPTHLTHANSTHANCHPRQHPHTHLGMSALASSGVSGQRFARAANSNLCNFFWFKSSRIALMVVRNLNLLNRSQ